MFLLQLGDIFLTINHLFASEGLLTSSKHEMAIHWYYKEHLILLQLPLSTASLLPEFQPGPCFLSAVIGHID